MLNDHWFDQLNKALVSHTPRRAILQAAGAIAAGLITGGASETEAAKRKDLCNIAFRRKKDRASCQRKRQRCKKKGSAFCIVSADHHSDDDHATCCPRGKKCCQSSFACAPGTAECCDREPSGYCFAGEQCCNDRCVSCPEGQMLNRTTCECESTCTVGLTWCNGVCVNTHPPVGAGTHCGSCNNTCDPGELCCSGTCAAVGNDPDHCGFCNFPCRPGEACCKYKCYDPATHRCCNFGPCPL